MVQTTPKHTQTVSGWAAHDSSGIVSPHTFKRRENGVDDVTIEILYCGICHTDLHHVKNTLGEYHVPCCPWILMSSSRLPSMEEEKEDDDQTAIITSTSVQLQSNQQMTTISRHKFGHSQTSEAFTIKIIENMEEEYGMFVWPCSIVLAEYVWQQRLRFYGVSVVELGAGTSLPGLVAAKVGSDVTLTDDSSRLEVLDNMRRTCDLNKLNCNVMGLSWGEWDAPIFSLQPKIVLGADVLYDAKDFDDLFATVTFLLQTSPGSVFITSYHNRSGHHLIEYLMVKWSLKCTKLLDAFSFMPSNKSSTLTGNIQLAEIMLDDQQTGSS